MKTTYQDLRTTKWINTFGNNVSFDGCDVILVLFDFRCVMCNYFRGSSFKEDEGTWKGNDDGKVVNNQPQRMMDDRNGMGPQGGYIGRITNDAREDEMEENVGQVRKNGITASLVRNTLLTG